DATAYIKIQYQIVMAISGITATQSTTELDNCTRSHQPSPQRYAYNIPTQSTTELDKTNDIVDTRCVRKNVATDKFV
ncbi:10436_t:CDS:2, partial [Cetraspora pellucida]